MKQRGKIIVIEGTDGSGKHTQSKLLIENLNSMNIPSKYMNFPWYETPTGRIVGQCYLGKEGSQYGWQGDISWFGDPTKLDPRIASLYYAADRLAASETILNELVKGNNLIIDRYYQSNQAHQGAKIEGMSERQAMFSFIEKLELELLKIPAENGVIFLHMPTSVAVDLRKGRDEIGDGHENNIQHLRRAEETYIQLRDRNWYSWKTIECAPDGTLNSLETPEMISQKVLEYALEILNNPKNSIRN